MIFLKTFEELGRDHVIRPCTINNAFHITASGHGGCFLAEKSTGEFFHVYKNVDITFTRNGTALFEAIDFGVKYFYERYFNRNDVVFYTPLEMYNFSVITDMCQSSVEIKYLVKLVNEYYINQIKPIIKPYDLHPQLLYDIAIENKCIKFLRPIKLIDSAVHFYLGQRNAFFHMLKLYARSEECRARYVSKENKIREKLICSPSSFITRSAPLELKCEYGSYERCMHSIENESAGYFELKKPEKLCKFALRKMLEHHEEAMVAAELEFSCQFKHNENDIPLLFAFNTLYKRTIYIHRMCLPGYLIGHDWYKWFKRMIDID